MMTLEILLYLPINGAEIKNGSLINLLDNSNINNIFGSITSIYERMPI